MYDDKKPLAGIRVVELANYVAAPIVGRMLADMGAEVIKIEGRGGDAWRATSQVFLERSFDEVPLYDTFNIGTKSISLNIKTEDGAAILNRLLDKADIFLTNTREKSLQKMGIDYKSIKDKYPKLIYATLTGYGYEGPDCDAPGFDNIAFWARSGFIADMSIKSEGSYPVNTRFAMGDTIAGTILFGSVMTALYKRAMTGKGDFVTMSLFNAGIWAFGGSVVMTQEPYVYPLPEIRGSGLPMNLPYLCSDGEWVRCTFFEYERYADLFFGNLGIAEELKSMGILCRDDAVERSVELEKVIAKAFKKQTASYWIDSFKKLDVVCGKLSHFKDISTDPQAIANDYIQKYTCCNGEERIIPSCPVRFGSTGVFQSGKATLCGENNEEILKAYGYSDEEIKSFIYNGTLL